MYTDSLSFRMWNSEGWCFLVDPTMKVRLWIDSVLNWGDLQQCSLWEPAAQSKGHLLPPPPSPLSPSVLTAGTSLTVLSDASFGNLPWSKQLIEEAPGVPDCVSGWDSLWTLLGPTVTERLPELWIAWEVRSAQGVPLSKMTREREMDP